MKNSVRFFAACLLTIFLLSNALFVSALADENIIVRSGKGDLSKKEALSETIDFFSQKCGLDEKTLKNAEWDCSFGIIVNEIPGMEKPHWVITTKRIWNHPSLHMFVLSGTGELLYWEAHSNLGYTAANPDLLTDATIAQPLESDAQEAEITQFVKKALLLKGAFSSNEIKRLSFQAHFIYQPHFNNGSIPVWLVIISKDDALLWKAVYGYNGIPMSLVPYGQDFTCYQLPGENFWQANFSKTSSEEGDLLMGVVGCTMPLEQRAEYTARLRPYVEQWIQVLPYYMNNPGVEYDITIRNIHGVPDGKAIAQKKAAELAQNGVAPPKRLLQEARGYLTMRRTQRALSGTSFPVRLTLGKAILKKSKGTPQTCRSFLYKLMPIPARFFIQA